jgi:glycogen synthase
MPTFKGKENGDSNCDGIVNGADYSVWRREYIDISQRGDLVRNNWESDFTGPNGKCDGVVNGYDYSLWRRQYYYYLGVGGGTQ